MTTPLNIIVAQFVDNVLVVCLLTAETEHSFMTRSSLTFFEGDSGLPPSALACAADFVIQLVDLFQAESFGFINEEVHKGHADETGAEPDEEDLGLKIRVARSEINQVGRCECDGPVEEPLHGS